MSIATARHARLTIDIPLELKERLRLACAGRALSMRRYLLNVLEERLAVDLYSPAGANSLLALTAQADPVLAELWDNEKDAGYDRL